jgi:hypothetical protein
MGMVDADRKPGVEGEADCYNKSNWGKHAASEPDTAICPPRRETDRHDSGLALKAPHPLALSGTAFDKGLELAKVFIYRFSKIQLYQRYNYGCLNFMQT